eukprot:Opistho-2@59458
MGGSGRPRKGQKPPSVVTFPRWLALTLGKVAAADDGTVAALTPVDPVAGPAVEGENIVCTYVSSHVALLHCSFSRCLRPVTKFGGTRVVTGSAADCGHDTLLMIGNVMERTVILAPKSKGESQLAERGFALINVVVIHKPQIKSRMRNTNNHGRCVRCSGSLPLNQPRAVAQVRVC